jgi:capsular exopolysaccharide synthesis family protein
MGDIEKFDPQPLPHDHAYQEAPYFEDEAMGSELPLGDQLRMVFRRWHIILLVGLLGCSVGIPAVWFLVKETYFTEGAILVKPILTNIITGDPDRGEISNYHIYVNTQAELIQRDVILERVEYSLRNEQLSIFPPGSKPMWVLRTLLKDKDIIVSPGINTNLLKITMNCPEFEEAQKIVNAFLTSYIVVNQDSEAKGGGNKLSSLIDLKKELLTRITMLQKQIKDKSQQYGMDDLTSRQQLYLAKVGVLREQITSLEMREIQLKSQVKFLRKVQSNTDSPSDLVAFRNKYINADLELQNLYVDIAKEENELVRAQQRLKETHPDFALKQKTIVALKDIAKKRRLEVGIEFDKDMSSEKSKSHQREIKKTTLDLQQTQYHLGEYRGMLANEEKDTKNIGLTQLDIVDLKEKLMLDRASYNRVIQRIQDVEMENKRPARISIAYYANTTGPMSRRNKLLGTVILGSLIAGVMVAFLLGKLDPSLRTPADVIRCIDLPVIGTTLGMRQIQRGGLPQQIEDEYQNIRANLGLVSGEGIPKVLVVTSAGMQEGKTTFSINLSTSMAKGGGKVLLIDGDFRKPDIGHALSLNGKSGSLQNFFLGAQKIEHAVTHMPGIDLDILMADSFDVFGTFELLAQPSSKKILHQIAQHYDHVVIDTAPLLAASDALLWAKMADAAVLVSFSGHTVGPELKEAYERLARINIRVLGTVLNSVSEYHSHYRYAYGYYDGKGKRRRKDEKRPLLLDQFLPDDLKS